MALQHLRSSTANKRPLPAGMSDGQLAINTNLGSPGVFVKDSNGDLVKVGPVHVGATAPNASPAAGGQAGNSKGELWLDTSLTPNELKTWDGSAWVSATGQEIPVSKLIDGSARQLLQTDAAGTGVEWTSDIDIPGTLDVTGIATFDERVRTILGSASTPAITAASDTNTGIFFGGADVVNIASNSATVIAIEKDNATADVQVTGKIRSTNTATSSAFVPTGSTVPTDGIYLPAANTVGISTGGSGRLFIDSSGRIGVGTSSPDSQITISRGTTSAFSVKAIRGNRTDQGIYTDGSGIYLFATDATNGSSYIGVTGDNVDSNNYKNIVFATYGSERLRIDSSGRVGIGSNNPQSLLHLETDGTALRIVRGSSTGFVYNTGTASTSSTRLQGDAGPVELYTNAAQPIIFSPNTSEKARLDSSGRLLVGTSTARTNLYNSNASAQVQVEGIGFQNAAISSIATGSVNSYDSGSLILGKGRGGTIGANTIVQNNDIIGYISFQGNDGTEFVEGGSIKTEVDGTPGANDMPGRLVFSTTADGASSPTERMRITQSGDVLINTTSKIASANAALHVFRSGGSSIITQQDITNSDTISVWNSATTGNNLFTVFYTEGTITNRGSIDYNRAAGQVRYNVTSDQRLKNEIQDASSALASLGAIKVRSYKWKETGYEVQYGFVAQELHAVYPDAVKEGDSEEEIVDTWAVDNGKLVPLLTKALQEAMERIEQLEAEMAEVKAQFS